MTDAIQEFHVGDVLSVTTGRLIGPGSMGGVYQVLDHMEGWSHFTHQLPAAAERMLPEILAQHPAFDNEELRVPEGWFSSVVDQDTAQDRAAEWVNAVRERFGLPEFVSLARCESEARNPFDDLFDLVGPERVLVVDAARPESVDEIMAILERQNQDND